MVMKYTACLLVTLIALPAMAAQLSSDIELLKHTNDSQLQNDSSKRTVRSHEVGQERIPARRPGASAPASNPPEPPPSISQDRYQALDRDGDGLIDSVEFNSATMQERRVLRNADSDRNNLVSPAELGNSLR